MKTCVFMITDQCNLACRYCYVAGLYRDSPCGSGGERDVVPEVLNALLSYKPSQVVIGGGEPMIRGDLFRLLKRAGGVTRVKLLTNGTLITRGIAERIRDCGVDLVGISLDSAGPEPHNRFRSMSHDAALRGIDCCREAGLRVDLMITVYTENMREVGKLLAFARTAGVERVTFSDLIPSGKAEDQLDLVLGVHGTEILLEDMSRQRETAQGPVVDVYLPQWVRWDKHARGCEAGKSLFALRPDGTILPCTQIPVVLGNILVHDLEGIWNSPTMDTLRHERRGPCASCSFREPCGGCRAKALAAGDLLGTDPSCALGLQSGHASLRRRVTRWSGGFCFHEEG